jgi:ClpP class serine protease
VGSIGVISQWFGVGKAMKELGIEHKTLASNTKLHEVVNNSFEDFNPEGTQSWIEKLE